MISGKPKNDIEQLKYIVKNGTCHYIIECCNCPLNCQKSGLTYNMVEEAKKLLNELRIKKLKRIL
jgi:hypothetical protein